MFLARERPSLSRVVTEIRSACWQQGLQPPTRRTVQRRLDAMDAREVAKAREGAKAARQKFAAVTGENKANQPLESYKSTIRPRTSFLSTALNANQLGGLGSRWRSTSQRGW
ncbi:DNA-binding domain-containing protein [Celeribacter ethanolicus]|uniref:DNA-binding domain-containing protein n=1 Tax=Celeribacter ethanolicus TaxID=1758178 RepID=UPI001FD27D15|nr:DNA-binding domain-containing protein [Celeribacter ethanolicus]